MKERPILFNTPMVRAILDGTKTQTRRVVKQQFDADAEPAEMSATNERGHQISGHSGMWWCDAEGNHEAAIRCPYGKPGDRLWVRETWAHGIHAMAAMRDEDGPFVYAATDREDQRLDGRWRPSIHMPRAASRITLEITEVRVERLQDISQADALTEGIVIHPDGGFGLWHGEHYHYTDPRESYWSLWESINGPGAVDANPWVWAMTFKRLGGSAV